MNTGSPPDQEQAGLVVEIVVKDPAWQKTVTDEAFVAKISEALVDFIEFDRPEYAVVAFAGDAEVQGLNTRFLGKDKPTNVLSFPAHKQHVAAFSVQVGSDNISRRDFLGDIILARETVVQEAAEQNIPLDHHVCHLIIHGILHLLGYDHDDESAAEDMETLETEILAALNISNPYTEELVGAG